MKAYASFINGSLRNLEAYRSKLYQFKSRLDDTISQHIPNQNKQFLHHLIDKLYSNISTIEPQQQHIFQRIKQCEYENNKPNYILNNKTSRNKMKQFKKFKKKMNKLHRKMRNLEDA